MTRSPSSSEDECPIVTVGRLVASTLRMARSCSESLPITRAWKLRLSGAGRVTVTLAVGRAGASVLVAEEEPDAAAMAMAEAATIAPTDTRAFVRIPPFVLIVAAPPLTGPRPSPTDLWTCGWEALETNLGVR